jgi:prolipoprotein diacylglyceryltransferase
VNGFVFNSLMSTSQFISLLLIPISVIMLVWLSRRARPTGAILTPAWNGPRSLAR